MSDKPELHKWESIAQDTARMAVPGGWIYWIARTLKVSTAVFVPTPQQKNLISDDEGRHWDPIGKDSWISSDECPADFNNLHPERYVIREVHGKLLGHIRYDTGTYSGFFLPDNTFSGLGRWSDCKALPSIQSGIFKDGKLFTGVIIDGEDGNALMYEGSKLDKNDLSAGIAWKADDMARQTWATVHKELG